MQFFSLHAAENKILSNACPVHYITPNLDIVPLDFEGVRWIKIENDKWKVSIDSINIWLSSLAMNKGEWFSEVKKMLDIDKSNIVKITFSKHHITIVKGTRYHIYCGEGVDFSNILMS